MGNYPSDVTDDALGLFRDAQVRVMSSAPHTTQIFLRRGVSLFGVLKQRQRYKLPFDKTKGTTAFLFNINHTSKSTTIEVNIQSSFQEVGFEFGTTREPYRLPFTEGKARISPDFQDIEALEFRLEKLTTRRPKVRFRWIHQPE
jgi:hypothetical protein